MLHVAGGLRVSVFAAGVGDARFMAAGLDGTIVVGSLHEGVLTALLTRPGSPRAIFVVRLLGRLDVPHSTTYHDGHLYLAEQSRSAVLRYGRDTRRVQPQTAVRRPS